MKRRAQAAMEFLMTYGWAILVVLIVIGALAYFGVLNPRELLPDKCTFPTGLYCSDHRINTTHTTFNLQNGLGKDITITKIIINESSVVPLHSGEWTGPIDLLNGQAGTFSFDSLGTAASGSKYKWNIKLTYNFVGSTLTHTMDGDLFTKIED